jgi:hypothetical protein
MRNLEIQTTELLEIKLEEQISCSGGYQFWYPTQPKLFLAATVSAVHQAYDFISGVNEGLTNALKHR